MSTPTLGGSSKRKGNTERDEKYRSAAEVESFNQIKQPSLPRQVAISSATISAGNIGVGCVGWYDDPSKHRLECEAYRNVSGMWSPYLECKMNYHPYMILEILQDETGNRLRCAKVRQKDRTNGFKEWKSANTRSY
jgi:hypothetical protein